MRCFCEQKNTNQLKVEADVGADPIWCCSCDCNLDFGELPLSTELKKELINWIIQYGQWIDWSSEKLTENAALFENEHNQQGRELTDKIKKELGPAYNVTFSPADIVRTYRQGAGE